MLSLQDKKALEDRLKEVQNILETVQNQRNELRQQYKEEKTARESLESQLAAARQQGDFDLNAAKENAQSNIAMLVSPPWCFMLLAAWSPKAELADKQEMDRHACSLNTALGCHCLLAASKKISAARQYQ